ncbi:formate dehydrogenase [Massilia sp. UMI-21]|nr:formate dehydrogenase [Massilia sp. UMI-21]
MEQHPQAQETGQDGTPAGSGPGAPDPTRRNFLKAAPLGALAVVAGSAGADEAPAAPAAAAPAVKRGYHETAHIRRYYETAAYW